MHLRRERDRSRHGRKVLRLAGHPGVTMRRPLAVITILERRQGRVVIWRPTEHHAQRGKIVDGNRHTMSATKESGRRSEGNGFLMRRGYLGLTKNIR